MNTEHPTIPENIRGNVEEVVRLFGEHISDESLDIIIRKVEEVVRIYRENISDESIDTIIRRYFGHFTSKKTFMLAAEMYPQSLIKYLNFDEMFNNYNKKNRFLFIDDATGFHVFHVFVK